MNEKILILDYGSQYTQLIARTVRGQKVYCEIHPPQMPAAAVKAFGASGIILSGGPQSAAAKDAPPINDAVFALGKPVLGVCYGMQAMVRHFGGRISAESGGREYGAAMVRQSAKCDLFDGVFDGDLQVWMSHGDKVVAPPPGFVVVAGGAGAQTNAVAAIADEKRRLYGLLFHPEVAHTDDGGKIIGNFIRHICGLRGEWTMPNFIGMQCENIRRITKGEGVLLALSGGVDSAVAAAILRRAIGEKLSCVMVDNGLLREGEVEQVRTAFAEVGEGLTVADAADEFFAALKGVSDPEEKRRRIGRVFVEVFEREAKKIGAAKWLAQGTIYPDVVESSGGGSGKAVIKTHHNVGGLPERLNLKILEPLRELFKDEVRELGAALALPQSFLSRHPFPGPGLAVRVLGEVSRQRVALARRADAVFMRELRAAGLYDKTAQAFVVLLPVSSVGVMGDGRTYENVAALRAVTTSDFMTADWSRLPHDFLAKAST
ncbi:MAG: glutamine-hydrolyzing GMP synthase, partial [Gammaproteobacteria bacterium]